MGERSGTEGAPPGRARALWIKLWSNRTKLIGYIGVIAASVQMAIAEGQHWQMLLLGAVVAAIGHYNERHLESS
jgi:hypothetical protein